MSLDVLVRPLAGVSKVRSWKIEGRKKGPHYVYHTVKAYTMLRDAGNDPQQRKTALALLDMALGRPGSHYNFLGHRPSNPLVDREQTGSGRLLGRVRGGGRPYISPREPLKSGDLLRIGYEDQAGHQMLKIRRDMPKGGRIDVPRGARPPAQDSPVFLVDRRERELVAVLAELRSRLRTARETPGSTFSPTLPKPARYTNKPREMDVWRILPKRLGTQSEQAVWLVPGLERSISRNIFGRIWWWLPPVVWPEEELEWIRCLENMVRLGARQFVLNAPWQTGLFTRPDRVSFWAGPMCNIANPMALAELARLGFVGAYVSPELDGRVCFPAGPASAALGHCGQGFVSVMRVPNHFRQFAGTRNFSKPQGGAVLVPDLWSPGVDIPQLDSGFKPKMERVGKGRVCLVDSSA